MNREELIDLVNSIKSAEGTEEEIHAKILLFKQNVPDPQAANYIYAKQYEGWTTEQIVDKALSYRPIQL